LQSRFVVLTQTPGPFIQTPNLTSNIYSLRKYFHIEKITTFKLFENGQSSGRRIINAIFNNGVFFVFSAIEIYLEID